MHHIIIRSPNNLTETVTLFSDKNYKVSSLSVMDIQFLLSKIPKITNNHVFIFTSVYAVQSLSRFFVPNLHKAFCVGDITAYYARRAGFTNISVPLVYNAKSLANLILKENIKKEIIYCTGVHRKPYLENYFLAHNIEFKILELYDAVAICDLPSEFVFLLKNNQKIVPICFSMRNANIFYQLSIKAGIDKVILNNYDWHIIGQKEEMNILLKQCQFYDTPQMLYADFLS